MSLTRAQRDRLDTAAAAIARAVVSGTTSASDAGWQVMTELERTSLVDDAVLRWLRTNRPTLVPLASELAHKANSQVIRVITGHVVDEAAVGALNPEWAQREARGVGRLDWTRLAISEAKVTAFVESTVRLHLPQAARSLGHQFDSANTARALVAAWGEDHDDGLGDAVAPPDPTIRDQQIELLHSQWAQARGTREGTRDASRLGAQVLVSIYDLPVPSRPFTRQERLDLAVIFEQAPDAALRSLVTPHGESAQVWAGYEPVHVEAIMDSGRPEQVAALLAESTTRDWPSVSQYAIRRVTSAVARQLVEAQVATEFADAIGRATEIVTGFVYEEYDQGADSTSSMHWADLACGLIGPGTTMGDSRGRARVWLATSLALSKRDTGRDTATPPPLLT